VPFKGTGGLIRPSAVGYQLFFALFASEPGVPAGETIVSRIQDQSIVCNN
jgi:hypothetical protein